MATYKELHGQAVKDVASDPTNTGEIFYNSSTDTFRSIVTSKAWSSTTALPQVAYAGAGAFGTQTEGVVAGGIGTVSEAETFEYNGSGWSNSGNLNTARHSMGSLGVQTAGLCFAGKVDPGGGNPANVEEYNGSTWSEVTDQPQALQNPGGTGTQTAGISIGGQTGPGLTSRIANSYHYDGTNWTDGGALPTATTAVGAGGTLTAAIAFGGNIAPNNMTGNTHEYNGSSWTASSGSMSNVRSELGGCGSQTAALAFGGNTSPAYTAYSAKTEEYDGTTWSEVTDLPAGTYTPAGFGTSTAAVSASGGVPGGTTAVNEWNVSQTITTPAAFSSGGSMGNGRYGGNFFGSGKSSQVAVGGQKAAVPPSANNIADSETYDGTTWSEGNNLNLARFNASGTGTETAGLVATGRNPAANPSPQVWYAETEEYDGTSYSEVNNCPEAAYRKCGAGTQTATIIVGGLIPPTPPATYSTTSQEYDGTNWTAGGAAPFKANYMDGVGVTTAAVVFGGQQDPAINNASYDYNGSSWTANSNMNIAHGGQHLVAGTVTDAIIAGGGAPYAVAAQAELYDGTSFSTNATLAQVGQRGGKGSTTANAIGCGGYGPGYLTATEEYTAASTAANVKTITTS